MSYTYLLDAGVESSAECFSDIPASVLSRLSLTVERFCFRDSATEYYPPSRFGTTYEPSMVELGGDTAILWLAASRVRTFLRVGAVPELKESTADYGKKCPESLARFDPDTHSLKTRQNLLFEASTECCVTLPDWGMMRDGECFLLAPLVLHTHASECFFWPTPRAGRPGSRPNGKGGKVLQEEVQIKEGMRKRGEKLSGVQISPLNPAWIDWLMGWPIGWTGLKPLETDKFQQWLNSHGKPLFEPMTEK